MVRFTMVWWLFFLSSFFSLLTLGFTSDLPKFNCVLQLVFNSILVLIISIFICVDSNDFWIFFFNFTYEHFISFKFCINLFLIFYCYFFIHFLIYFSILSLNILFHLIFVSNFSPHSFDYFFFKIIFLIYFVFQLSPNYFLSFNCYIRFGSY